MNWLENFVYGLISGFARFMPISSTAHQAIFRTLCGFSQMDPLQNLLIDIALLAALITGFKPYFDAVRSNRSATVYRKRRYQRTGSSDDLPVTKNALLPMLVISLILYYIVGSNTSLLLISAALLANGIILFIPSRSLHGNKDGRSMSILDSCIIGTVAAFSALPGISGIGCTVSTAETLGADSRKSLQWAALLTTPMLIIKIFIDFTLIFSANGATLIDFSFLGYLLSVIGAYIGGYTAIMIIDKITARNALSGFAYYSWGAALFTFILYLTVA